MVAVRLSGSKVRRSLARWSVAKFLGQACIVIGILYAVGQAGNYDYELAIGEVSEVSCCEALLGTFIPCALMLGGAFFVKRSCEAIKFCRVHLGYLSELGIR